MTNLSKAYFNTYAKQYDTWYEVHKKEYHDQLEFLKSLIPKGHGIEIGVGTGRFAAPLHIEYGLDHSSAMLKIAQTRGIKTILSSAYAIPFRDKYFDFALYMVTLCFLSNPVAALKEANRVATQVISVILDKHSEYIHHIMIERKGFYQFAQFFTKAELLEFYTMAKLTIKEVKIKDLVTQDNLHYTLVGVVGT